MTERVFLVADFEDLRDDLTSWPDFLQTRRPSISFGNSRKTDLVPGAEIAVRRDIPGV